MVDETPPLEIPTKASPVRSQAKAADRRRDRDRRHRRDVLLRPASHRRLPRRLGRGQDADLGGTARAGRGDGRERPHVRAAVASGASGPSLSSGVRRHTGLDGVDVRRARRRGPGHGRLLRDAARLGIQRPPGGARGDRDGRLEPARHLWLPADRARAARRQKAATTRCCARWRSSARPCWAA